MGFPIIGESLEFLSTGRKGYPEKFIFDRIAKYSSQVFKTCILGQPTTVVWVCKVFLSIDDPKDVAKFAHLFNNLAYGIISIPIDFPGTSFIRSIKASKVVSGELPHIYRENKWILPSRKGRRSRSTRNDIRRMKYSCNVACEVMRLAPPLRGFHIPKGWKLYWSANSTHRNPECFLDPETFDPTRFEGIGPEPYNFVPFGGGPRMCPGKEYARLEILVFMHNLVKRFRWEKLIPDEKIIVDPLPYPAKQLPIHLFHH
ncbi:unnamed protein product [Dovyalis caffra]|uniref:Cytochrome P450 n=1 Tax=Dovyalis caffra TaxID=77055 RepID=A0AAV1RSY8_9ROSI|nr:unnamed protein product [Dovyalis caffra]